MLENPHRMGGTTESDHRPPIADRPIGDRRVDDRLVGDRRSRSRRAALRRRAAEGALLDALLLPDDQAPEAIGAEGQTLLSRGIARLARQEGITAAVAWAHDRERGPRVLAAQPGDAAHRIEPTPRLYSALGQLPGPTQLGEIDTPAELQDLGKHGLGAVAPIAETGRAPSAILLAFVEAPGRILRPRTMAVLTEITTRLRHTLSTRSALDRLGRLDDAVRRLDRLAALGGLVSEIVHEIRNPLVSVKTFLQLVPERLEDPNFHHEFRLVVSDEVARLERMLDDLLRHARPESRARPGEGASIGDAIATTCQLLGYRCRERGIGLETEIARDLPALALSDDALRQLLMNLLLNASEAAKDGGRIGLRVDWSDERPNHLELQVEDDGPGIDPALAESLFEPFWTTRSRGVGGLGLSICKRIVEEAGGAIGVDNGESGGARFRIELPITT